jgi:hypothetical protein
MFNLTMTITAFDDSKLVGGVTKKDFNLVNLTEEEVEYLLYQVEKLQTLKDKTFEKPQV